MKIYKVSMFILMLFTSFSVMFGASALDRSGIVIKYQNFGWNGENAGWDADEALITPDFTLDYLLHSTNRDMFPGGTNQYVIFPEYEENWGEQITNAFTSNDNVVQKNPSSTEDGAELRQAWITWDTNWLYIAMVGNLKNQWDTGKPNNQGVNFFMLFDFNPGHGYTSFPLSATWDKKIFTRDFDVDMYCGIYGGWDANATPDQIGGFQWRFVNQANSDDVTSYIIQPGNPTAQQDTNQIEAYYNGVEEFDPTKRVLLAKLNMKTILSNLTNASVTGLSNLNNVSFKLAFATVDGNSGSSGEAYDSMPNNLAGMSPDNNSVIDNYFIIPLTDSSGNLLTNVSAKYHSKINFLPGSRVFNPPSLSVGSYATNTTTALAYNRKIFVPDQNERMNLMVTLQAKNNVFKGYVRVYNLRGELVKTLTADATWSAPDSSELVVNNLWDGTDSNLLPLPMGTYIVVFSGITEDGLPWNDKTYVSLLR